MKILFLTNLLPYPLDNGGKIKTYTTIKNFFDLGHEVDLMCFKENKDSMLVDECEILKICKSVVQVYLPLTTVENKKYMINIAMKSIFSKKPFSIYKYKSKDFVQKLTDKSNNSYDIIYFDHLPMCVYLDLVRNLWPDTRIILDEHNCESVITKRKEKETKKIGKKIFLKLETIKLEKFEAESIKHVTKTIVLSNADYASLKTLLNRDFIHEIIPIGVQDRGLKKNNNNTELNILFIGTLTWEPNNLGLIWFLKEVIPIIEKERLSYHLYIVGKNPSNDVRKICEKYKDRITITGYVESVDEYYDKCDLAIVPLFIGSGQRVKLIEAFSKGMPAISTEIGAEGLEYINNKNIVIANNKNDFARAIFLMEDEELRFNIGNNARRNYDEFYSSRAISRLLEKAIS